MDFSFKSMASRGKWNDIFKVLNERKKSIQKSLTLNEDFLKQINVR